MGRKRRGSREREEMRGEEEGRNKMWGEEERRKGEGRDEGKGKGINGEKVVIQCTKKELLISTLAQD